MANTFDNAARDTNPCLPLTHDLSRFEEYKLSNYSSIKYIIFLGWGREREHKNPIVL